MKNLNKIFILFIISWFNFINAQVIVSPYIVYMDEQNKFGSMIVQNESLDSYEISISFIFGYPISDSLGNRTMKYIQDPKNDDPSITDWIKAFPKKIILKPKERQTIRLMIKPPSELPNGTYWTRIVTSSKPVKENNDSLKSGINARLNFVLNQVTTAIYRTKGALTELKINEPRTLIDSTNSFQVLYPIELKGNSPFYGYFYFRVFNSENNLIKEQRDFLSIYTDMVRNYHLPDEGLEAGKYIVELEIEYNEKEDIPESKIPAKPNINRKFELLLP